MDITLPTNIHVVKAMVFPVLMYGCESWTLTKTERQRIDAFELWCWKRLLESPLDCKKIKPVNPKEINPEYSLEGLMLKLQYFGHLMQRAYSLKKILMLAKIEGRRRRGQGRKKWLEGITDSMDLSLSKFQEMVKNREAWPAAVYVAAKSQTRLSE